MIREQMNQMPKANYRKVRIQHPITLAYLHIGGAATTKDVKYSWLGTRVQVARLREIHAESGLLDGFEIIRRQGVDQGESAGAFV